MNREVCRYYVTYSGMKLPLNLMTPLQEADIANRNTYFRAAYDEQDRMLWCEKVVYGEVELRHRYQYDAQGRLARVEIAEADDEPRVLCFDEAGNVVS